MSYLPISISSLLGSTSLAFTAIFAYFMVKHKFTDYSVNMVVLMMLGSIILGVHMNRDRLIGESNQRYMLGFVMTLVGAALHGFVNAGVEYSHAKAGVVVTFDLVVQMQFLISMFSALFCIVTMIINKDFQALGLITTQNKAEKSRRAILGILLGICSYLYNFGMSYLPISISSLLGSTSLAFTAIFAYFMVKHKFTDYSVNMVVLMMLGSIILGVHMNRDRLIGESNQRYMLGFVMTLVGAALHGFVNAGVEYSHAKAGVVVTFDLVVQMQFLISMFSALFCIVTMIINKDFQALGLITTQNKAEKSRRAILGILLGICSYLYNFGMSYLPISISSLLGSTSLAFTAIFAYFMVKHKFTDYSVNMVVLMMLGSIILGVHMNRDRLIGESNQRYMLGFVMTLVGAALHGFVNAGVEYSHAKAGVVVTFDLVVQMQFLISMFSALFCIVTMIINKDFQALGLITTQNKAEKSRRAILGILLGICSYLYNFGMSYLPISISSLLGSTSLAFTAIFAYFMVKHKFTDYSVNMVVLMMLGSIILGVHMNRDRLIGESNQRYMLGFVMTLVGAALHGFVNAGVEYSHAKAGVVVTFDLVVQMQFLISMFSALFCIVTMIINKDFQAITREAEELGLGQKKYYMILALTAISLQAMMIGSLGMIFCSSALLFGIVNALLFPIQQIFAVIFLPESFNSDKWMALAMCLWGFASYFYGE
ncbi:hypothetical protein MTR67_050573 [Solanum verrucosum]|uniref:Uncharacterized protein n=1 Tax=Solanum verrucosum TaxID=315347 RepID=A0AAF0V1Q5_SOLVR|nr:hypothetical protein MTR67_050573 [Solanum verrucosum]